MNTGVKEMRLEIMMTPAAGTEHHTDGITVSKTNELP